MKTRIRPTSAQFALGLTLAACTLVASSAWASTPYMGADIGFGQSYSAAGGNPGVAYNLKLEGGYIASRDSWNRIEIGLGLFTGGASFRNDIAGKSIKSTTTMGPGALVKLGYGYSLGENMVAVWRLGAGMTSGSLKTDGASAESFTSPVGVIGMDLVMQTTGLLDIVGGLEVTHYTFDVNGPVDINALGIRIGMRMRLGGTETVQSTGRRDAP